MSDNKKAKSAGKPKAQYSNNRASSGGAITYLGPTVKGVARNGSTFKGGLPKALKELINNDSRYAELCVETPALPNAIKQLSTEGSVLNSIYNSIVRG